MPIGGEVRYRPSCRQLAASAGFEPVKISTSPSLVMKTHLSSMPSPASRDQLAPAMSFPPSVAAPANGIFASTPPTAALGRYQASIEPAPMKYSLPRYYQTSDSPWPNSTGVPAGPVILLPPSFGAGAPAVP